MRDLHRECTACQGVRPAHPTPQANSIPCVPRQAKHCQLPGRLLKGVHRAGKALRQLLEAVAVWAAGQRHHCPMRWVLRNARPRRQELYSGQRIDCSKLLGESDLREEARGSNVT